VERTRQPPQQAASQARVTQQGFQPGTNGWLQLSAHPVPAAQCCHNAQWHATIPDVRLHTLLLIQSGLLVLAQLSQPAKLS
jgi:hypothetical protein